MLKYFLRLSQIFITSYESSLLSCSELYSNFTMATGFNSSVPDADWSGGLSNLDEAPRNVPNRGPGLEAGSIVFLVLASLFIGLRSASSSPLCTLSDVELTHWSRLYTRAVVVKEIGIADYLAFLAYVREHDLYTTCILFTYPSY